MEQPGKVGGGCSRAPDRDRALGSSLGSTFPASSLLQEPLALVGKRSINWSVRLQAGLDALCFHCSHL